jgi:hypothetical protein
MKKIKNPQNNRKKLVLKNIEKRKKQLNKLVSDEEIELTSDKIIKASQDLDKSITQYYKINKYRKEK